MGGVLADHRGGGRCHSHSRNQPPWWDLDLAFLSLGGGRCSNLDICVI